MRGCKRNSVILEVTNDEYELPIAVFNTTKECADFYNQDPRTINSTICRKIVTRRGTRFIRVIIGDEDEQKDGE